MAIKYNKNLTGTAVSDELQNSLGSDYYSLDHDTFFGSTDFDIYTAAASGGTHLVENTHYTLHDEDTDLTTEAGQTVYTTLKIVDPTYQGCDLYFTYKTIGDYNEAEDINNILVPDLYQPKPWNKSLFAYIGTQLATGTANTNTANKLVDSGATWSGTITAGDIVHNTTDKTWATILIVESNTSLRLNWDAFPDGNEGYNIYDEPSVPTNHIELTGALLDGDGTAAADTNTGSHLIDADGTDWTTNMAVGDWAFNLNTGLVAKVTAVAAHDLTLQWDCFPDGNEPYLLYANTIEIDDTNSKINNLTIYEMNISGRFLRPGITAEVVQDHLFKYHRHEPLSANSFLTGVTSGGSDTRSGGTVAILRDATGSATPDLTYSGTTQSGNETRPRNLSMTYIMRIK